ncbi:MAG: 23S rRNA (uracil(1939)-C(5))-methyltransferase RlmD [Lachnospiraceae bacterium]|nr:23S rRNA (uracil(1939)-C(5))-methyltransferase RlmD [Lachnospiraceae bacterium]
MKKGTEINGVIEYVDFPNKGVLFVEDEKVIIKGTLPGQKVRGVINKARKGKAEARLLEVEEKSAIETKTPTCPHFGICGGCTYQTIPYETQLELKSSQVKKLLDNVIEGEYEFEKPLASPKQWQYRNKMEFSFGNEYKDGPITLGLHKKGSFYDIVPVCECQIIHPDMREILKATTDYARESGLSFYHKMSKQGYFRHLLVRRAEKTGEILVDLVTTTQAGPDLTVWVEMVKGLPCGEKIVGILHTVNDSAADAVIDQGTEILFGKGEFTEELLGLKFKITPFSFFQTNSLGAEVLYSKAREYVGSTNEKVIFDLYSGTGTIGQLLAPVAKKVIGIEIIEEAVVAARENAAGNGLINCEFIAGDVLKKIDEVEDKPDFIVLDPPREGINPKALGKILGYGVDNMVYISCKPSSLANDLVAIQAAGYKVKKVCCVDMFPGTVHVETVCLLSRKDK